MVKTILVRIKRRDLARMRKVLPQKKNENRADYIERYVEMMNDAERQENFCN